MNVQLIVFSVILLDTLSVKSDVDIMEEPLMPRKRGPKPNRYRNGVEFNEVSRSELLKILATFEESIQNRLQNSLKKIKPYFTAEFANNRYTKPFILPKFTKKKNLQINFT